MPNKPRMPGAGTGTPDDPPLLLLEPLDPLEPELPLEPEELELPPVELE